MTVTASMVKTLRDRTQASMMDCKRALVESDGDIDKAVEIMRKAGQAKAQKKSSRVAAEGTIVVLSSEDQHEAVLVEVNCETDFVAREEKFKAYANAVASKALELKQDGLSEALQDQIKDDQINLIATLGENVSVRRVAYRSEQEGVIGIYTHGDVNGTRIGVLMALKKGSVEVARDLAMQVAAMRPDYLTSEEIPAAIIDKEKEIILSELRNSGRPEEKLEQIASGKLNKFKQGITLVEQTFVKDPNKTVKQFLKESDAEPDYFVRFEVGEGIEKKEDDFVKEVMSQARGD